jgi:hypothetical protein
MNLLLAAILLAVPLVRPAKEARPVSIFKALDARLVTLEAQVAPSDDYKRGLLKISNISNKNLELQLPPGCLLATPDTSVQDYILLEGKDFALAKGQTRTLRLHLFCTESDKSPLLDGAVVFSEGRSKQRADLLAFLGRNKYEPSTVQHAFWALEPQNDLSGIYGPDFVKALALQQKLAEITGKPLPAYMREFRTSPMERFQREVVALHGSLGYLLKEDVVVSLQIYDAEGKAVKAIFENMPQRKGEWQFKFKLETSLLAKGHYVVKATDQSGNILNQLALSV